MDAVQVQMIPSHTDTSAARGWQCESCRAGFAAAAPRECPFCGGAVVACANPPAGVTAAAVRMRHDRDAFAHAALAFLAGNPAVPDEVVAGFAVPPDLVPLYVPFRRVQGAYQARFPTGAAIRHVRGTYHVDVCVAAGLDDAEASALEAAVAGYHADDFGPGPAGGPVLLDEIGEARVTDRAERLLMRQLGPDTLGCTEQVAGEQFYLVPVWMVSVLYPGRPLRLMMEAGGGRFIGLLPASVPAGRAIVRLDVLGHWAWLPALFCILLAAMIDVPLLRGILGVVAVATLAGGYLAAAELRRALARARLRLAAALASTVPDAHGRDPAPARRRLVLMQRAAAWLPGIYASVAVAAHLGVTAYVADRATTPHEFRVEAGALVPWAPSEANLRVSPLAPTRALREQLAGRVELAASPPPRAPAAARAHILAVGPGGYPDLAAAVAAASSGDTIRIAPGRYPGPRLSIQQDLVIEGQGAVTFVWQGGRGPFLRIGGHGTRVTFSHLRFEAYDINTAVLGDPNEAYGEAPAGMGPQVRLSDVTIESPQASAVYSTAPGARYLVEGGSYRGAGAAIIMINGSELVVRPYRGSPTRIASDGTSGVAANAVGLSVQHTRHLSLDSVQWSGNPGGDVAIEGDAVAVDVGRAAEPGPAQRVLLVDEQGAPRREIDLPPIQQATRFTVERGALRYLPTVAGH